MDEETTTWQKWTESLNWEPYGSLNQPERVGRKTKTAESIWRATTFFGQSKEPGEELSEGISKVDHDTKIYSKLTTVKTD